MSPVSTCPHVVGVVPSSFGVEEGRSTQTSTRPDVQVRRRSSLLTPLGCVWGLPGHNGYLTSVFTVVLTGGGRSDSRSLPVDHLPEKSSSFPVGHQLLHLTLRVPIVWHCVRWWTPVLSPGVVVEPSGVVIGGNRPSSPRLRLPDLNSVKPIQ